MWLSIWPAIPLTDIYKKDVLTYFKAIPLTQDKEDVLKHVGIDLHITNMVNAAINDNGELVREAKLAVCERDLEKKAAEDLCEKWKKE